MALSNTPRHSYVECSRFFLIILFCCTCSLKEENDVGEFFLTLEKDPQQEDFLQGRMQGNPYR